jgi:hypothetical protein
MATWPGKGTSVVAMPTENAMATTRLRAWLNVFVLMSVPPIVNLFVFM